MALIIAGALFTLFTVNVVMGSLAGAAFLNDVGEMLLLFAASIAFVMAILHREAAAKRDKTSQIKKGGRQ